MQPKPEKKLEYLFLMSHVNVNVDAVEKANILCCKVSMSSSIIIIIIKTLFRLGHFQKAKSLSGPVEDTHTIHTTCKYN